MARSGPTIQQGEVVEGVNRVIICGDMVATDVYCANLLEEHDPTFSKNSISVTLNAAETLGLLSAEMPTVYRKAIHHMADLVFSELRSGVFDFGTSDLLARLRAAGRSLAREPFAPPKIPVDLLYLQRKAGGLFLLGSRLRARVAIAELLESHL